MRGSGIENPQFCDALSKADAVLCGNDLRVNDRLFDTAPNIKAIAKMGAG